MVYIIFLLLNLVILILLTSIISKSHTMASAERTFDMMYIVQ